MPYADDRRAAFSAATLGRFERAEPWLKGALAPFVTAQKASQTASEMIAPLSSALSPDFHA